MNIYWIAFVTPLERHKADTNPHYFPVEERFGEVEIQAQTRDEAQRRIDAMVRQGKWPHGSMAVPAGEINCH